MTNINDYQDMIPFDTAEYNVCMTKSANLKDEFKAWKLQTAADISQYRVEKEIAKYNRKTQRISDEMEKFQDMQQPTVPSTGGKNLSNLRKLQKNIEITFTPFSVIISVKSGMKKMVIQTIEAKDMPDEMLSAWKTKNALYFKTYMSAKMQYSIQTAEHRLIMDGIKNSIDFQRSYSKQASELCDEYDDEIPFMNMLFFPEKYAAQDDETFEKLCQMGYCFDDRTYTVTPIDDTDDFLNVSRETGTIPKIASANTFKGTHIITPENIKKNGKVVFLTDRVVYVLKDMVVASLLSEEMNTTDILHLKMKDKAYFLNKFARQAKILEQRKAYYGMSKMEKRAAAPIFSQSTMFALDFIHPYLYKVLLDKKLGKDWTTFDEFVIIKNVETMFKVEVIANFALNKILSIAAINSKSSDLAFTSIHAFEKIIRSFNDLPIDFAQRETDSIDGKAIVFGLSVMDMCTPFDIYEKLSPDVCEYIVKVLRDADYYALYPNISDATEPNLDFISTINQGLLRSVIRRDVDSILNKEREAEVEKEDEIIQAAVIGSLDFIRTGKAGTVGDVSNFINDFCVSAGIDLRFAEIAKMHVEKNLAIDAFLKDKQTNMESFASIFRLR